MKAKAVALGVVTSEPCRTFLSRFSRLPHATNILNSLSLYRGVFANLEQAWSVAGLGGRATHNHPDFVELEFDLSRGLRSSDYAALYWFLRIAAQEGDLKVFDFGGGAGNLFYLYSGYLKPAVRSLTWTVFDFTALVERGRQIAVERKVEDLRFTSVMNDVCDANVLLVSAALHYWEKSIECFIHQFNPPPEHVILNRTHLHEGQSRFITVQRKGAYAVPCIVRTVSELVSCFAALGYVAADRWLAPEQGLIMPLFPQLSVPHSFGFYFRRGDFTERT